MERRFTRHPIFPAECLEDVAPYLTVNSAHLGCRQNCTPSNFRCGTDGGPRGNLTSAFPTTFPASRTSTRCVPKVRKGIPDTTTTHSGPNKPLSRSNIESNVTVNATISPSKAKGFVDS